MRQHTSQKGKRHATDDAESRRLDEDMIFMDLPVTYPVQTSSVAAQRRFSEGIERFVRKGML